MYNILYSLSAASLGRGTTASKKSFGAAAAGAAASILGGIMNTTSNLAMNSANRQFAKQQQKRQNDFEEYMTKNYTSIQGQVQSARAGGLNPNALFANGVSGSAAPVPAPVGAETSAPNAGQGLMNAAPILASMRLNEAQANKADSEANNIDVKTPMEYEKLRNEVDSGNPLAKLAWENTQLDMELKRQDINLKRATTETQRAMSDKFLMESEMIKYDLKELKPLEKQQIQQGITQSIAQTHLLYEQGKLTKAQVKLALAETYKTYMDAVSNRMNAQANLMQGAAAQQNAATNAMVGQTQASLNTSLSVESQKRSVGQQVENETKAACQQFVIKQMETSTKILGKQNSWTNAREFGQFVRDFGVGVGSLTNAVSEGVKSFGSTAVKVAGFGF